MKSFQVWRHAVSGLQFGKIRCSMVGQPSRVLQRRQVLRILPTGRVSSVMCVLQDTSPGNRRKRRTGEDVFPGMQKSVLLRAVQQRGGSICGSAKHPLEEAAGPQCVQHWVIVSVFSSEVQAAGEGNMQGMGRRLSFFVPAGGTFNGKRPGKTLFSPAFNPVSAFQPFMRRMVFVVE